MASPTLMPGAEPFAFEGGQTGVLLVHGYTGTPQGMREWGEHLASQGHTVLGPRLPGHGTRNEDLHGVGWDDWVDEAQRAMLGLFERCSNVFVCGLSMGGGITLELAARHNDRLAGLCLVNPFLFSFDPRQKLLPVVGRLPLLMKGVYNDIADPKRHELGYPKISTKASQTLVRGAAATRRKIGGVTVPALIFASRQDHVVDTRNATAIFDEIGSADKELVWLERSYHVATLDYDRDVIFERSARFIAERTKE